MDYVVVHKKRTNIISVSAGFDVSQDIITSEIREEPNPEATLIATWSVSFLTDGIDGELILTLDDSATDNIDKFIGWMDMKRITGGEPVNLFDDPLEVHFKDVVTV